MSPAELRRRRRQAGLTQAQLAAHLGVHAVSVARWEAGSRAIAAPTARLIRLLLGGTRSRPRARRAR